MAAALELKVENKEDEKVTELVNSEKKITEEKIEKSLNYDELSEAEKKAVDEFNAKIDVYDSTQILQYGAAAQNKISNFSDHLFKSSLNKTSFGDLKPTINLKLLHLSGLL